jgi:flagellar biosynthesis protein FlhG
VVLVNTRAVRAVAAGEAAASASPASSGMYAPLIGSVRRAPVATAATSAAAARPVARTIAVTSGKGGVGKSNLVANLAIGIARLGKSVLVLDADMGLANLDVLLGVRPLHTLYHVFKGKKDLLDVIINGAPGVKFIAGGSGMRELADLDDGERQQFLDGLRRLESYTEVVLIDTGAGISANVMSFVSAADEVVVVTTPEPTAMADAYGIIKTLAAESDPFPHLSLVVNRVRTPEEGAVVAGKIFRVSKQFLEVAVNYAGYVLEDVQVARAVRAQRPFMTMYPNTLASVCVSNLVARMFGAGAPVPQASGLTSLMDRIRGYFGR